MIIPPFSIPQQEKAHAAAAEFKCCQKRSFKRYMCDLSHDTRIATHALSAAHSLNDGVRSSA
jgi:hypothetical protein